jgi:hypothetical protein
MAFDKDIPTSGTSLRASNPQILANQSALQSALDQDHEFTNASGSAQSGKHQVITIKEQSSPGASSTDEAYLTAVDSGTQPELEFTSEDGTAVTITKDGDLYANNNLVVDGDIDVNTDKFNVDGSTGNTDIAGTLDVTGAVGIDGNLDVATNKFTVDSSTGNTVVAGTLGVTGATSMSSTLAMGSNKITGVDDGTSTGDAVHYGQFGIDGVSGNESITLPGGLTIKFGSDTSTTDTEQTFTFNTAFDTVVRSVQITKISANDTLPFSVSAADVNGFSINRNDSVTSNVPFYWMAIGY